ncbi:MAG: chorismate synthase [Desulfobacteraceae bacterium 4572_130]|nr:MAG: chorismate synthase [Desulfobacteraceae bacterium 4572_130]
MSGSSFGKIFKITTFGESHGKAVGVIVQGCPSGVKINETIIQHALNKRKTRQSPGSSLRKEPDIPEILSGTFKGVTTGTPIMIMIKNQDIDSKSYEKNASLFRPGHGDITYQAKYGIRDWRGGGRASARETAARVAAGAVAKAFLKKYNIKIQTYTIELGGVKINKFDSFNAEKNKLQCPDINAFQKMEKRILEIKKQGDSVGGVVQIVGKNIPSGLGEPVFDKLDANIAKALMSIGSVKAVEIGAGCQSSKMTGFENNDEITKNGFKTNNSGGILAGISNGDDILAKVYVKPVPSILKEQKTIDENGNNRIISTKGRHDVSAIPRINSVCKAMMFLVIADHMLMAL